MTEGKLLVIKGKTLQVKFTNKKGKTTTCNVKESELSGALQKQKQKDINQLDGVEVELEEVGGQPKQIREKGKASEPEGDFHNPYNFIPALVRDSQPIQDSELGDRKPACHGFYGSDLWSGKMSVRLTTATPLLVPDAANADEVVSVHGHYSYPVRMVNGKPYPPPTSIKGMLRSAYEAVTNSRLSVFHGHSDRLAYRTEAKATTQPARVEKQDGKLFLRILEAVKLPRYQVGKNLPKDKGESHVALKYDDGSKELPQHGDAVWLRWNRGKVSRIQKRQQSNKPGNGDWRRGWVCITGANIDNKKYERVFVESDKDEKREITRNMKSLWEELIRNYQKTHEKELQERWENQQKPFEYLGEEPGKTAWSRHIDREDEAELKEGTLCYVEIDSSDNVTAIQPVTISRRLYSNSPEELLHFSLKPAQQFNKLSPADRVFGWVNQYGKNSYKGNLRIRNVRCQSDNPISAFGHPGFPLAILGQPKPQQSRFYTAQDKNGTPLEPGTPKNETYLANHGLRGRKVYPHHANLPENYWDNPKEDRTQKGDNGYFQEYRQPNNTDEQGARSNQNRSIQAWVKPDTEFTFEIDIKNLSDIELGALLYLLSLPQGHYHRFGGGKPLGFGSVRLEIDWNGTDLRRGKDWCQFYSSLYEEEATNEQEAQEACDCIDKFKNLVAKVYGNGQGFEDVRFIQAFTRFTCGFQDGKPIHYPRIIKAPNPEGKSFAWFVENDKLSKSYSLDFLEGDRGLPILEETKQDQK
ncbi:TIGR03986 family CRISPR-associated RAMP protein [Geitlerinema sp. PCC 9228]|uniref:TIGR03986 family type III CRISPR-associated RAMP protein n=1 Tax=Geitlerinema sp. PCC 9228 TaxID=111611 RepID=UPI0008F9BE08|nr:TIGR03986 family CRISPR-associated RAMP protein [Geitlerinema sp. PCC 9228]